MCYVLKIKALRALLNMFAALSPLITLQAFPNKHPSVRQKSSSTATYSCSHIHTQKKNIFSS